MTLKPARVSEDGVLVVKPREPLSTADFAAVARVADVWIQRNGELRGLLIVTETFPGWENLAGFASHLRFVRDHHAQIRRVAVACDSAIAKAMPHLARHFISAEIRHFAYADRDRALDWLREATL